MERPDWLNLLRRCAGPAKASGALGVAAARIQDITGLDTSDLPALES